MADTKTSALTGLTGAGSATGDQFIVLDVSDTTQGAGGTLKIMTRAELVAALKGEDARIGAFTSGDETKLDGIETGADVTDTTNVTAAGALMDSEVTNLSGIKTLTVPDNTTISAFGATLVDDVDASTARTTLGLVIGTNVQGVLAEGAFVDGDKTKLDGIETGADVTDATNVEAAGAVMDADVGVSVQAYNGKLQALSDLTGISANRLPYFDSGTPTMAHTSFTAFARTLLDDADAATARTTLGLAIGSDVQAYDADTAKTDVDQQYTGALIGSREVLGSQASSVTWNMNNGRHGFTVTLTGNATINNPTNAPTLAAGQFTEFVWTITQDATGSRVPTVGSNIKNFPTLSTTANAVDVIAGIYDGTDFVCGGKVTK